MRVALSVTLIAFAGCSQQQSQAPSAAEAAVVTPQNRELDKTAALENFVKDFIAATEAVDTVWKEYNKAEVDSVLSQWKADRDAAAAAMYSEGTLDAMKSVGARQLDISRVEKKRDAEIQAAKDKHSQELDAKRKAADDLNNKLIEVLNKRNKIRDQILTRPLDARP